MALAWSKHAAITQRRRIERHRRIILRMPQAFRASRLHFFCMKRKPMFSASTGCEECDELSRSFASIHCDMKEFHMKRAARDVLF